MPCSVNMLSLCLLCRPVSNCLSTLFSANNAPLSDFTKHRAAKTLQLLSVSVKNANSTLRFSSQNAHNVFPHPHINRSKATSTVSSLCCKHDMHNCCHKWDLFANEPKTKKDKFWHILGDIFTMESLSNCFLVLNLKDPRCTTPTSSRLSQKSSLVGRTWLRSTCLPGCSRKRFDWDFTIS